MKDYFKTSIIYYYNYLQKEGYNDPLRVVISDILETIEVPKEQRLFLDNLKRNDKEDIKNIITLLTKMKTDNEVNLEAMDLILKRLKRLISGVEENE